MVQSTPLLSRDSSNEEDYYVDVDAAQYHEIMNKFFYYIVKIKLLI